VDRALWAFCRVARLSVLVALQHDRKQRQDASWRRHPLRLAKLAVPGPRRQGTPQHADMSENWPGTKRLLPVFSLVNVESRDLARML